MKSPSEHIYPRIAIDWHVQLAFANRFWFARVDKVCLDV